MAAEDEGRTEEPSEYKLKKARDEGRIPKSQELNSSIAFLTAVLMLVVLAKTFLENCADVLKYFFNNISSDVTTPAFYYVFVYYLIKIVLPVGCAALFAAIITNIVQNKGFLFTTKTIIPKFSKIIPKFGEYFKNTLFSLKGTFNIVKSIGKVIIIIALAYTLLSGDIGSLSMGVLHTRSLFGAIITIGTLIAKILITTAVIFILISVPDYFVQKRDFMESMKMTKQEQKQEYKEMEGDPEVKSHLDQLQKQMLSQNLPKATKEADVIITNPTHFAVALKYDKDVDDAPKITAKGADELAHRIKSIARETGVPIIENRPLARALYHDCDIGDTVPAKFLRVLADIYATIMRMGNKKIL